LRNLILTLLLFSSLYIFSKDASTDANVMLDKILLKKENNNVSFSISNTTNITVGNNASILIKKPNDVFYPYNDTQIQVAYHYPINKNAAIGCSGFFQNVLKIFYEDVSSDILSFQFNGVVLPGLSFRFTPFLKKINMPIFLLSMDVGFGAELTNNDEISGAMTAKFGGFLNLFLLAPIVPAHLFISDINSLAIMATYTPDGWYPGIRIKNILNIKFAFLNFVNKKINSGIRVKNIFSYVLTGRPDFYDLTSQYTYNKLFVTLYYGGLKGVEFHIGYGFEYLTLARDPSYHLAHKVIQEISWQKSGFAVVFKHTIAFWEGAILKGFPNNEAEISFSYRLE